LPERTVIKPLNVMMSCLAFISGGAVTYMRNLAPLLYEHFQKAPEGHRLKFLAHEEQKEQLQSVDASQIVWLRQARPTGYARMFWEYWHLPDILNEGQIDVFFTPYQVGPRIRGPKHVMMIRNMEPFLHNRYRYSVANRLRNHLLRLASVKSLRGADRVIAVSKYVRRFLIHAVGIEAERIHMIYHGRNLHLTPTIEGCRDREALAGIGVGKEYLLTCGSLLPYRRCEDIIAAFNICCEFLGPAVQLAIAGSGTDRRYAALIDEMIASSPYKDRILLLGNVPWETVAALYRNCLVCVIATEVEACPNIAIEAMSAGCAVVSSQCPPVREIFQGCALEYRARDPLDLSRQIKRFIEDSDLCREFNNRAVARAEAFSWEKCARATYSALVDWEEK